MKQPLPWNAIVAAGGHAVEGMLQAADARGTRIISPSGIMLAARTPTSNSRPRTHSPRH